MAISPIFKYRQDLQTLIVSGKAGARDNENRMHNAQITSLFLEKGGVIRMYCGEMSVFRKGFYERIKEDYGQQAAEMLEEDICTRLTDFFNDESNRLEIILAKKHRYSDLSDLINEDAFTKGRQDNRLVIKVADPRKLMVSSLSHFMYSEKSRMVRIELDPNEHEATFYANVDQNRLKGFSDDFRIIESASTEIGV